MVYLPTYWQHFLVNAREIYHTLMSVWDLFLLGVRACTVPFWIGNIVFLFFFQIFRPSPIRKTGGHTAVMRKSTTLSHHLRCFLKKMRLRHDFIPSSRHTVWRPNFGPPGDPKGQKGSPQRSASSTYY